MALTETIAVAHKKNPNLRGVVVTEHLIPQVELDENQQQIIRQQPLLGVCWSDKPAPAIDYCSPFDLIYLGLANVETGLDEDEVFTALIESGRFTEDEANEMIERLASGEFTEAEEGEETEEEEDEDEAPLQAAPPPAN